MNVIWNPHDRLFKQLWRERNVVADFLRTYLPGDVSSLISAGSVELCKDSFVSADLKEYFSDLLYRADMGGRPGYLYVLLEHKSRPAPLVPLQLLGYIKGIWDLHLKQSPLPLPMVVPVVLYHGRENWRVPCCLSGLLEDHWEGLTRYVPDFEYHLIDLSSYDDQDICGHVLLRAGMLLFKYVFQPEYQKKLPEILMLLKDLLET